MRLDFKSVIAVGLMTVITCLGKQGESRASQTGVGIDLDGHRLFLGMTKSQVASKLSDAEVTKINDDEWMLGSFEKGRERIGPTIQFTNGKLSYADREWSTSGNANIAGDLFGVVSLLNSEGFSRCTITADTNSHPSIRAERVWIECGEKTVLIIRRVVLGAGTYDGVSEQLGKMRSTD